MKNKKIKHRRTYCMRWKRCTSLCINLSPSCYWEGQIWLARVPARKRDMMGLSDLPRGQRGLLPLIESLYSRNHLLLPLFPNPSNSDGIHNFSCKKTFLSEGSLTPVLLEEYSFLASVSSWSFVIFPMSIQPHWHWWHKCQWYLVMREVYWLYDPSEVNDLRYVALRCYKRKLV